MEKDPTGIGAHEGGAKLDGGKVLVGQILGQFPRALTHVAGVGTVGRWKYSLGGWKQVPFMVPRYTDAMIRHWLKACAGSVIDEDVYDEEGNLKEMGTMALHDAQIAWNALARLEGILEANPQLDEIVLKAMMERAELFRQRQLKNVEE